MNQANSIYELALEIAQSMPENAEPVLRSISNEHLPYLNALEQEVWDSISRVGPLWSNIRLILEGRDQHPCRFMLARIGEGWIHRVWWAPGRSQLRRTTTSWSQELGLRPDLVRPAVADK